MPILADIGIVSLLILCNGFFAMAELALVSARRARLKQLADEGHGGALVVMRLAEDPSSFLSIVQIGMTLNSVLAGAFSGATLAGPLAEYLERTSWLAPHAEAISFGITVVGVTYFNLVLGELLPKRVGLAHAERIAVRIAWFMVLCANILAPVVWLLKWSTELCLRLIGLSNPQVSPVTEEEVKHLIAEGAETGAIKPAEKAMLDRVMRLADRTVRTIMTPRMDMVWLDIADTAKDQQDAIRSSGYSRFPVARGDLEEILGVVHAKDVLNAQFDGQPLAIQTTMRPALIVPDTTPVLRLLDQFRNSGQHIAVVVDEYGTVEGLVSVTDILEAVTGELPERDRDEADKSVQREDGSWLIDGMTPLDEVETLIGLRNMRSDGDDFHTLAGFVVDKLGRIPSAGDHFVWDDARFEVVDMDGRRVDKVLLYPPATQEPEFNLGN